MSATAGYVSKEWVVAQCTTLLKEMTEIGQRREAEYARPWYTMEWSWLLFKKVEKEHKWSSCNWTLGFNQDAYKRLIAIAELAQKAHEIVLSPEDFKIVNGNFWRELPSDALPSYAYYKD